MIADDRAMTGSLEKPFFRAMENDPLKSAAPVLWKYLLMLYWAQKGHEVS